MLEMVKNEEQEVLKILNGIRTDKIGDLVELHQGERAMLVAQEIEKKPLESIDDIYEMFERVYTRASAWEQRIFTSDEFAELMSKELVEWAYDKALVRANKKLGEKLDKLRNKGMNRAKYINEPVYVLYKMDNGRWRWKFTRQLRSFGLLSLTVNSLFGEQTEPVALGILVDETGKEDEDEDLILGELRKMVSCGVAVSGRRLGSNRGSPGWGIFTKCFPLATDASAYGHGLNAPVLPEGYLEKVSVTFKKLKAPNGQELGTDGSGFYNPTCPEMSALVARYGLVPFQFRLIEPNTGLFAKGALFPSEQVEGLTLDLNQIKGSFKAQAKEIRGRDEELVVADCHVGIINCWSNRSFLTGSFEVLENIRINKRTISIVKELVERAMNKLAADGLDGLAAQVARKDETIKFISQLCHVGRQHGLDIHSWQVPRVQEAIKDRLCRALYEISNGAGIKFPSYVVRMDSTVPKGRCVVSGMKPNIDVVGFRVPNILAQGCQRLRTVKPSKHHLVDGKMPINQVILNPADCIYSQGDDDGDIMGISSDPLLVELFSYRLDEKKFHIEPKGVERLASDGGPLLTNSDEGLEFLIHDHRGPVGRATIWRARLLAVGDENAARAMSIGIQECVDKAKRLPAWSDYYQATNPDLWRRDELGEYHWDIRLPPEALENGDFPMSALKEWVDARLMATGCIRNVINEDGEEEVRAGEPLWWRFPGKRINIDEWYVPAQSAETDRFENLVHVSARHTFNKWLVLGEAFETTEQVNLPLLLPVIYNACGIDTRGISLDDDSYTRLKDRLGLTKYNQRLKRILEPKKLSEDIQDEASHRHYVRSLWAAQLELEATLTKGFQSGTITLMDVMTVWIKEANEGGNLNNAFRVICWNGSPVLQALGVEQTSKCGFLTKLHGGKVNRLDFIVDTSMKNPRPFDRLHDIIQMSKHHHQEVMDANGNPVHFAQCHDCMDQTFTAVVRAVRERHQDQEQAWLKLLLKKLKA